MAKLNKAQEMAVNATNNVVVVIAGAGSGKTTVLTKRVSQLIKTNAAKANEILAITFTNKATKEMKERLAAELLGEIKGAWILTFHAFAVRVIRENLAYLPNHDQRFLIIDEDDKKKIIKDIIENLGLKGEYKTPDLIRKISSAKTYAKTPKEVGELIDFEYYDMYNEYEKYLSNNNAFDFDDLLNYCHLLLQVPEIREKYQNRFKYIHVDEYQDTSEIQGNILTLIKSEENNLFIVGDVDQSIYGWRGATIDNIMNLERNFDDVNIIKLEQNYRSTQHIIEAANSLIENNNKRYEKNLWTNNNRGDKILAYRFHSAREEADFVKNEINYLIDFGKNLDQMAVLYRYNYQSKRIEESLMRARIPYVLYGGIRFYERMEIKDMIAYIRLINNNNDNISFLRIINVPKRKVGEVTLNKIKKYALENELSYFQSARQTGSKPIKSFCEIIKYYQDKLQENFESEIDNLITDIGYYDYLLKLDDKEKVEERAENIRELKEAIVDAIAEGETLETYLTELTLFSERENDANQDAIILSTVHGVKGLEFDYVFLTGVNEQKFPKAIENDYSDEMEEERRVAYVAITRAKKKLTVTNISYDFKNEYYEDSRFIKEMGIENTEEDIGSFIF